MCCLSCSCMEPANAHGDKRTLTYKDYQSGDRNFNAAAAYNKDDGKKGTVAEAKTITQKTLAAIKSGKVSPTYRG